MKHLLIIGARGYGRGLYDIVCDLQGYGTEFDVKGYLDDKSDALDGYQNYPPIIDSVENYVVQEDDVFACALGDVNYKKHYVEIIKSKGGQFMTIIHPTTHVGGNVRIGEGCIIGPHSVIDCDVAIGNFVNIQTMAIIGHDSIIGDWSMVDCHTFMGGFSSIGSSAALHTGAKLLPKLHVGDNSIVNAGSVVIRNVKPNSVVMGNPARESIIPKMINNSIQI